MSNPNINEPYSKDNQWVKVFKNYLEHPPSVAFVPASLPGQPNVPGIRSPKSVFLSSDGRDWVAGTAVSADGLLCEYTCTEDCAKTDRLESTLHYIVAKLTRGELISTTEITLLEPFKKTFHWIHC